MSWRTDWRDTDGRAALLLRSLPPESAAVAPPIAMGDINLTRGADNAARYFGTDRKTFLLVGGAGVAAGILFYILTQAARRGLRRGKLRAKRLMTPRNLAIAGGAAVVLGAAYLYYNRRPAAAQHTIKAVQPTKRPRP